MNKIIIICIFLYAQIPALNAQEDIKSENLQTALLKNIFKNKQFVQANEILKEFNLKLNEKSNKLMKTELKLNNKVYDVQFEIIDPKNEFDYKTLTFSSNGESIFVYFSDINTAYKPVNALEKVFGCSWRSWSKTGENKCDRRLLCGKKNDWRATFSKEQKVKTCSGDVKKVHYRWVINHCGC